jgi:hypothetical protein
MLDDRKLYFPISSDKPPGSDRAVARGPGRMPLRKWRPVGPDDVVVTDRMSTMSSSRPTG